LTLSCQCFVFSGSLERRKRSLPSLFGLKKKIVEKEDNRSGI